MAMQTDFLTYRLTIGLSTMEGRGFYYPSATVIGQAHRLYVLNRSLDIARSCPLDGEALEILLRLGGVKDPCLAEQEGVGH